MSKPSKIDKKVIKSEAELVAWFRRACKPAEKFGLEHEKPPVYADNHLPVPYQAKNRPAIKDFLEKMAEEGDWRAKEENGNPIYIERDSVNWSLEPGGQLETGGAPLDSIHDSADETDHVLAEAIEVADNLGIKLLAIGYHPTHSGDKMPFMPISRMRAFAGYIAKKKIPHGLCGMCCTSTVQVNLDYESEVDMVKKLRVALSLQPIAVALFANSPFNNGKPSGFQSYRSHIIHNYMEGRYGFMLPVAFEEGFGFERFVQYALHEMPLLGVYNDDGVFVDVGGKKFSDFMAGKLDAFPGRKATFSDWENHLNTIWSEVRLRRFLEMRGVDSGPAEMIKALPAFWAGILYDQKSLDMAYEMVRDWTNEDREYLRGATPKTGLQTKFMYGATTVQELAKNCLALAEAGLKRRAVLNDKGQDESIYLAPLHEIARSGKNLSLRLLEKYHSVWQKDIRRLFNEQSYDRNPSVFDKEPNRIRTPVVVTTDTAFKK